MKGSRLMLSSLNLSVSCHKQMSWMHCIHDWLFKSNHVFLIDKPYKSVMPDLLFTFINEFTYR